MLTEKEKLELSQLLEEKKKGKLPTAKFHRFKELMAKQSQEQSGSKFGPGNDFTWWNKVYDLLKDAVNIKSNFIPGMMLDENYINITVPGVIRYGLRPFYGAGFKATDPINVWARDLYLRMFQKYRGISAYSASDLGITIIAGVEVVAMIAILERIYGVVNRYSKSNINMPYTEVEALGLTQAQAEWIRNHLSDFRYDLNILIKRAQRLCIPRDLSVVKDVISLFGYEYLDHDNKKAQIIICDRNEFGIFDETFLPDAGGCIRFGSYRPDGAGGVNILFDTTGAHDNMFVALDNLTAALVGSDGVQKIYGDLVTWFGEEQMLQFDSLPEDYVVVPVYSESILHKLHNIDGLSMSRRHTVVSTDLTATDQSTLKNADYTIYQVNGKICTLCTIITSGGPPTQWISLGIGAEGLGSASRATGCFVNSPSILDTYRNEMTEDIVTEGMMYKYALKEYTGNVGGTNYYANVVNGVAFFLIGAIDILTLTNAGTVSITTVPLQTNSAVAAYQSAGRLAIQDWAPIVYYMSGFDVVDTVAGDLDTCVPVYPNVKKKALEAIFWSGVYTDIKVLDSKK